MMNPSTRIYASGALAFGEQAAIDNLLKANYSVVIVWSVHVDTDGTLFLNDTKFVSNGVYAETKAMNLPPRLAQLRKAGIQIIFSVGAGGTNDFTNIHSLLNGGVPGKGSPLYDNFKALKDAMMNAGGDIDAVDFDNEDYWENDTAETMVNFGLMLSDIGYKSVTLCPYENMTTWTNTYNKLTSKKGYSFVSAVHLQCYSGGSRNNPDDWAPMIAGSNGATLLIPSLATNQAAPGPWWDEDLNQRGGSVVQTDNVAMYKGADWSGMLHLGNFSSADEAMYRYIKGGGITGAETFFFYCNGPLDLGPGKQFQTGDAVFFGGKPWWGSAPQATGFSLSGGCSNIYNPCPGACPIDIQNQFAGWKKSGKYPINGGFIWLYDSIVNCLLSNCCGEGEKGVGDIAKDFKQAIINGLS